MSRSVLSRLAEALAKKNGLAQHDAEAFVKEMFDVVNSGLNADKLVKVRGLGAFKVTTVKDRESVDVNTGSRILIEGRDKINFTPDTTLRELVNKPFAQFETVVLNDGVDFSEIDSKFESTEEPQAEEADEVSILDFDAPAEEAPLQEQPAKEELDVQEEFDVDESNVEENITEEDVVKEDVVKEDVTEEVVVADATVSTPDVEESIVKNSPDEEPVAKKTPAEETLVSVEPDETVVVEETPAAEKEPAEEAVLIHPNDSQTDTASVVKQVSAPGADPATTASVAAASEQAQEPCAPVIVAHEPNVYKYIALIASALSFVLVVCLGVLSYQYHKVAMQRNQLQMSLSMYKGAQALKLPVSDDTPRQAKADSLRMEQAAKAVESAEAATKKEEERLAESDKPAAKVAEATAQKVAVGKQTTVTSSKYDDDPRVRTGAYRIVGVAQTVTVKKGQTLSSISRTHLGPDMECYVEAINGTTAVKEGQKLKIPKLELRRKR